MLTKTTSVLERAHPDFEDLIRFVNHDDDTGEVHREYFIPRAVFEDMNCPDTITVTVEPGDLGNATPA